MTFRSLVTAIWRSFVCIAVAFAKPLSRDAGSNPNTLTDFVLLLILPDSNLLRYADQGVILNLEDYIDNNMPYLQKVFEQYPEYRTMCTDSDGHIWALPWIPSSSAQKRPPSRPLAT